MPSWFFRMYLFFRITGILLHGRLPSWLLVSGIPALMLFFRSGEAEALLLRCQWPEGISQQSWTGRLDPIKDLWHAIHVNPRTHRGIIREVVMLTLYLVALEYGPFLVQLGRRWFMKMRQAWVRFACRIGAFVLLICILLALPDAYHRIPGPNYNAELEGWKEDPPGVPVGTDPKRVYDGFLTYLGPFFFSLSYAVVTLTLFVVAASGLWTQWSPLSYVGRHALGIFLSHQIFFNFLAVGLIFWGFQLWPPFPQDLAAAKPYGDLAVFCTYCWAPVLVCFILAPLFQVILFQFAMAVANLVSEVGTLAKSVTSRF